MRKSLQSIFITGLMTVGITFLAGNQMNAQEKYEKDKWKNSHQYDWGNPDIPYVETRSWSIGFNLGETDLMGDVGTKSPLGKYTNNVFTKDILGNSRFMGGMFLRYTWIPGLSFRWGINYGSLYATDEWNKEKALKAEYVSDDAYQRYVRNLDIKTNIWETNLLVEFSPFRIKNWEFGNLNKSRFQPYLLAGVTGFYFNPRGTYKDLETGISKTVDLQPLRTEGEGFNAPGKVFPKSYSLFSYGAILGIGVKWDIGRALGLGLEYQLRYTFTDNLDDVSGSYIDPLDHQVAFLSDPKKAVLSNKMSDRSDEIISGYQHKPGELRGDPSNKDMYSTLSIIFYWKIKKRQSPWWNTY